MTLRDLILSYPGYVDATDPTDAVVLAWLEEAVTAWRGVPWLELQLILYQQSVDRATIATAASGGVTIETKAAAQLLLDTLSAGVELFTADERVRTLLNAAALPAGLKTALIAYAQTSARRDVAAGLSPTRLLRDVAAARSA